MNQRARLDPVPIPFIDVAAQRRRLGRSVDEAIARVLGHCQFILGPKCAVRRSRFAGVLRRASRGMRQRNRCVGSRL
jgi:hypothetical protein